MLINMVDKYDAEQKQFLKDLWTKVVLHLGQHYDAKKIFTFLSKSGIVSIDEKAKHVYIVSPMNFHFRKSKSFLLKDSIKPLKTPTILSFL